ncbi:RNA 2',3'-cyclic phosphodiesterase [Raoultibacter timonensis]|uniref:RNA 2',3'-cyclic phosphodiesterase n=1 Tax=Raoultibacter timonensis TaxID=1907662 RepID=A0ABM7WL19_9ACTN|nr:RNA 2',3'-cyclic phosphodiesterase [Raoultibacter timonensis]BDE97049.1 RNA 2',3'-cyclic phosphodiesterase [Raoultibacter timonensis]BDF51653.1 RNA 2',3'-cyclic phosphodiesterase [Raoultibacter timonensis]
MRVFVALELPQAFASDIAALSRQLKYAVEGRFLAAETYHLTLAFLGEATEAGIASAIEAACTNAAAIPLRSDGLGKFGRASDATLWLGIAATPDLMRLAETVREELGARGVAYDGKPFKPHITLARRVRIPRTDLPPLAFPLNDEASAVTLFKSTLARDGATYKPLYTARLEAKPS